MSPTYVVRGEDESYLCGTREKMSPTYVVRGRRWVLFICHNCTRSTYFMWYKGEDKMSPTYMVRETRWVLLIWYEGEDESDLCGTREKMSPTYVVRGSRWVLPMWYEGEDESYSDTSDCPPSLKIFFYYRLGASSSCPQSNKHHLVIILISAYMCYEITPFPAPFMLQV